MKRNVDLTLDRKFSRETDILNRLRRNVGLLKNRNAKYPWEFKAANARYYKSVVPKNPNFHTGDKATRKRKRIEESYFNGTNCECCGRDLTKKPWIKGHYLLCNKCETLMKSHNEYLWPKKIEEKRQRKVREKIYRLEDILNDQE